MTIKGRVHVLYNIGKFPKFKTLFLFTLHPMNRFPQRPQRVAVRQPEAWRDKRLRVSLLSAPGKYLCLITGLNVKNASRKSWHWIYFRKKKKWGGAKRRKSLNNVETLLWLAEPPLSLSMFVFCINNGGSVHSSPALLSPCPIFASSVFSSYRRRQQREKAHRQGSIKRPGTHPPLSRCHSSSPLPPGQLLSQ